MRENTIQQILESKIIVIVRGVAREDLIPLTEAMYAGGIRLLELTYDAAGKIPAEETAENIRMLSEHFAGRMLIGAGTVLNKKQVELTKDAGGKFIISPDTCPDVIAHTVRLGLVSIPGALTPTEMQNAHRAGADFIKVFPTDALGLSYLKAVMAPLSHLKMLAVGGVNAENIREYMSAGVCGAGIGSGIVNKKLIAAHDWNGITESAKRYTDALREEA